MSHLMPVPSKFNKTGSMSQKTDLCEFPYHWKLRTNSYHFRWSSHGSKETKTHNATVNPDVQKTPEIQLLRDRARRHFQKSPIMALPSLSSGTLIENQGVTRNTLALPFLCSPDPRTSNQTPSSVWPKGTGINWTWWGWWTSKVGISNHSNVGWKVLDSRTKGNTSRHRGVRSFCHCLLSDASSVGGASKWRQFALVNFTLDKLGSEVQGYTKIPQYDRKQERVFVSILFRILGIQTSYFYLTLICFPQGILTYMFHGLLRYSTSSIFPILHHSHVFNLAFWSGNVYNCICLAEFQNSLLTPKKALEILCSFLAIPSCSPNVFSLLGFDGRINKTSPICVVPTFGYDEFHEVLAGPCVRIFDRYDHQSVLQFLLMKHRTATDSAWLDILSELRQVSFFIIRHAAVLFSPQPPKLWK